MKDIITRFMKSPTSTTMVTSDVAKFAKHAIDEILNFGHAMSGDESRLQFSPHVLHLALSFWMTSMNGYD